jgi:hypothetical protein
MGTINIWSKKKSEIEKYGFSIVNILSSYDYFKAIFSHLSFYILGILSLSTIWSVMVAGIEQWSDLHVPVILTSTMGILFGTLLSTWTILLAIYITFKYSIFRIGMMKNDGSIITNNTLYSNIDSIPINLLLASKKINSIGQWFLKSIRTPPFFWLSRSWLQATAIGIIIWIILIFVSLSFLILSIWIFLIWILITYILQHTMSLQIFLNHWSRIQSLTPLIESKSREIEKNFSEDMDFGKLRSGFSDLSMILAKVSESTLKLEAAEKRVNKWNLFDSVKYITSLMSDIMTPLVWLRSFLTSRATALEKSKWEMSRIRMKVGWWEEALALQSARTEPLMLELRKNIEKLDEMIEKIG